MIDKVHGNRFCGELNWYIVEMWKELIKGWIPEIITKEQYKNYYLNDYYNKDYTRSYGDEILAAHKRIQAYEGFLKGKILDVGCGLGGFVDLLREKKFDCWGQEITFLSKDVSTYQSEIEDINFPTDYFQTVTLHDVLEHIIDPIVFLKEVFRLTSQEGHVIIDFPNFFCEAGQKHWRKTQHLWMFDYKQLAHLLKSVGFTIIKMTEPIPGKIVYYYRNQNKIELRFFFLRVLEIFIGFLLN